MKWPAMYEIRLTLFEVCDVNVWRCQIFRGERIILVLLLLLQSCGKLFFTCDPKYPSLGEFLVNFELVQKMRLMAKISKQCGKNISFLFSEFAFFLI